jgi:hypothetical protein
MFSVLDIQLPAPTALSSLPFEKEARRIFTFKFKCWLPACDRPAWEGNGHQVACTDSLFFVIPVIRKPLEKSPPVGLILFLNLFIYFLFYQQWEYNVFHKLMCWQESSLWTFWRGEIPSSEGVSYSWLQVSWPSSFQSPWDIVTW